MVTKPTPSDPAGTAIAKAEALVKVLESSGGAQPGILAKAGGKVPVVRDWRVPVALALVLFAGQALVSAKVDDGTVAAIFAVGAVTVAILTGIVAALSYAQQSAIPFADFLAVIKELLVALKAIKAKGGDSSTDGGEPTGSGGTGGGGNATEGAPIETVLADPPHPQF
jgi:hypothetical protein